MAAKKTADKPSKSDFIRDLPKDMSVADVIAKGKEAGISFTSSLVYMVRGRQDGTTSPKKKTSKNSGSKKKATGKTPSKKKKTGAKKTSSNEAPSKKLSSSTKPGETKADFVRARAHLSPKEVVEDAKSKGVKLDAGYVYNVRGYDKATAIKKARASGSSVEELLKAAAAELGLGRAIEVLQGERARVRAVLGG